VRSLRGIHLERDDLAEARLIADSMDAGDQAWLSNANGTGRIRPAPQCWTVFAASRPTPRRRGDGSATSRSCSRAVPRTRRNAEPGGV